MKLKQINQALFKLFIPCDELEERGVNLHTLAVHSMETHGFFHKIVYEALSESGNIIEGCFQMDVYTYPFYGVYILLKRDRFNVNEDMEEDIEGSLSINIMEKNQIIYEFSEFDDVVQACRIIQAKWPLYGILYHRQSSYYLEIEEAVPKIQANLMAILLEYGEFSTLSKEYLEEYGNRICKDNIFTIIKKHFCE